MNIDRETREELKKLSKEVFGVSSRWQTLLRKGYSEVLTRTIQEEIPGENGAPSTFQDVKVPVLTESGGKQSVHKYYTVESIRELMLDLKAKREAYLAEVKKKQEEAAAKKAQEEALKKVSSEATGSALGR